jgi:hypothetical protein
MIRATAAGFSAEKEVRLPSNLDLKIVVMKEMKTEDGEVGRSP